MSFGETKTLPLTKSQAESMAEEMTEARKSGAVYHVTNAPDSWYCTDCGVFGKGGETCWCCDSKEIRFKWVPRFGGGTQSQIFDETQETESFFRCIEKNSRQPSPSRPACTVKGRLVLGG